MNEADKLIIKQLLDYCHAVEQRIADYGIDENKFINDSALFDMLLMPVFSNWRTFWGVERGVHRIPSRYSLACD